MFVGNTGPSEVSQRFSKLSNPSNVTYSFGTNSINLSWASPGTPSAVDVEYLTNYFNDNWKIKPEKYLKERISYNRSKMGTFGFNVYLTSGTKTTYVGWTKKTSYSIDTTKYNGIYDGVIVKSVYSRFKKNASDGYKVVFDYAPSGENVDQEKITISMKDLNLNLTKDSDFNELNDSSVTSIKYDGVEIKQSITNLNVILSSISKDGELSTITPNDLTQNPGTYIIAYTVSFVYNGAYINKLMEQTVIVE
jgi:hypothetical protein